MLTVGRPALGLNVVIINTDSAFLPLSCTSLRLLTINALTSITLMIGVGVRVRVRSHVQGCCVGSWPMIDTTLTLTLIGRG